jgi:[ribosomal protein S18]-alanine N-acetyltransferase
MTLRIASSSEFNEIKELFFEVYESVPNKASFNWPLENIETELSLSTFLVCEDENKKLCGFISYRDQGDVIEIMALGTASHARGKNVMASLLSHLQDHSRTVSKPLRLEVHAHNLAAISLYNKLGFTQIGVRKAYYVDRADALTFQYQADPS